MTSKYTNVLYCTLTQTFRLGAVLTFGFRPLYNCRNFCLIFILLVQFSLALSQPFPCSFGKRYFADVRECKRHR